MDATGSCYIAGVTDSTDFPLLKPIQTVPGGKYDLFVAALTPDGSGLVFSSHLGGSSRDDWLQACALDASGNFYLAGYTHGTNFPVVNALQSEKGAGVGSDGFIIKVAAGGTQILYSTYFGGSEGDDIRSMALDQEGNLFINGIKASKDLPVKNAAQPELREGPWSSFDFFYAKIQAAGSDMDYCSYFGGYGIDLDPSIAVGNNGTFVIAGWTTSAGLSTVAPPASTFPDFSDTIVALFDASSGFSIFATYLGGDNNDYASGVAMDGQGDIYVAGETASANFPTRHPIQADLKGITDLFLTKLRGDDLGIAFSTYFGGIGKEEENVYGAGNIALNGLGNVFITGRATSTNEFPIVNPFQADLNGDSDAFVAKISFAEVLKVSRMAQSLVFTWPAAATGYQLESTIAVDAGANWTTFATAPIVIGDEQVVTVEIGNGAQFFRLSKP